MLANQLDRPGGRWRTADSRIANHASSDHEAQAFDFQILFDDLRIAVGQTPTEPQRAILADLYRQQVEAFVGDPAAAHALLEDADRIMAPTRLSPEMMT